jgi:hypothetical protein
MLSLSVSFFGDALNRVNVMGCAVVFFGVFLYKIVFHIEKEAKKAAALQTQSAGGGGEVDNLIRNERDDTNGDNNDNDKQVGVNYPARYVELMDRNTGKATAKNRAGLKKMTEEALGREDEINDEIDDDHPLPKIQVV